MTRGECLLYDEIERAKLRIINGADEEYNTRIINECMIELQVLKNNSIGFLVKKELIKQRHKKEL